MPLFLNLVALVLALILIWSLSDPQILTSFTLETNQRMFPQMKATGQHMATDGSIVIGSGYTVWHFESDGSLRLKFGRRGEGPGEFQHVWAAVFDGSHYWVSDGKRLTTSKLDATGSFQQRYNIFFNAFYNHPDGVFYRDGKGFKQLMGERRPVLGKMRLEQGRPRYALEQFHVLSEECVHLFYNYNTHFVDFRNQRIYVMDEVAPKISAYNAKNYNKIGTAPLRLLHFKPGPKLEPGRNFTRKEFLVWEDGWSRITGFAHMGDAYAVSYEIPAQEKNTRGKSRQTILVKLGLDRKPIWQTRIQGRILGRHNDKLYVLNDWDENKDDFPVYKVDVYQW